MAFMPTCFPLRARIAAVAVTGGALTLSLAPAQADTAPQPAPTTTTAPAEAAAPSSAKPTRAQLRAAHRAELRARATRQRTSLVRLALSKRGSRYVSGAAGPNVFDCSGFVMWVYKHATGKSLPHFSGAQMARSQRISIRNLKPGDLLFFGPGGSQHVSMYIGKGRMIHATNPSSGVHTDSIRMGYYKARFAGAGRIIKW